MFQRRRVPSPVEYSCVVFQYGVVSYLAEYLPIPVLLLRFSIVVSRVTLRSAVARQIYTVLRGGIPVLTVKLLKPVLQLLVKRQVIPIQVHTRLSAYTVNRLCVDY